MNSNTTPLPTTLHRLDAMPLELPEAAILARLGYRQNLTELSEHAYRKLKKSFAAAFALARPQGRWRLLEITEISDAAIHCSETVFPGRAVVRNYGGCRALWLAAATIGNPLAEKIHSLSETGNVAAALVYDAVGSETADAALDFLQKKTTQELRQAGGRLTRRRFSPGYSDFPLESQRLFFELLSLNELNLQLNERCYFLPEKTVTAIAGVV